MAVIGLSDLHYAIMKQEDTATTAPVYDTPKRLIGVNSVSRSPQNETATLYGDNQALATVTKTKEEQLSFEVARMPLEDQAALLGRTYDSATKKMSATADDAAPYVAIMYALDTDEGKRWLYVFYKGKFAPANDDANTQGGSLEFGLHNAEGTFVSRINDKKTYDVIEIDSTDTTTANSFFASVGGGL